MPEWWSKERKLAIPAPVAAETVSARLLALPGVESACWRDRKHLLLRYDLRATDLQTLLDHMGSNSVEIPKRRWRTWWHALLAYCEANERQCAPADSDWNTNVRRIYVSRYRHRRHGHRDDRPQHWRQYLEPRGNEP